VLGRDGPSLDSVGRMRFAMMTDGLAAPALLEEALRQALKDGLPGVADWPTAQRRAPRRGRSELRKARLSRPSRISRGIEPAAAGSMVVKLPANKAFSTSCGISAAHAKSRRSFTPILATKHANLQDVFSGSDGTRTRDLRRDRPVLPLADWAGIGGDSPREQGVSLLAWRGLPGAGGNLRGPRAGPARDASLPEL